VIVLAEDAGRLPPSASARDIAASTEAARLAGLAVYTIPPDFDECETAENALWHVPAQTAPIPAFWIGYIPTPERYAAIYDAAQAKNLLLPNTLEQHRNAQEFDRTYPKLGELTPRSITVIDAEPETLRHAADALGGFPIFVKGAIQSRKAKGWKACVAETPEELTALVAALLSLENRSRGRVLLRELLSLRFTQTTPNGFPMGREFRAFVYHGEIVGLGYYWESDDPLASLSPTEEHTVCSLAIEAAQRVGTPYIAVDIGQTIDNSWYVIETGDAQFSGLSRIPKIELWHRLRHTSNFSETI